MIAQMAQFSQVSGIAEINRSLGNIASMLSQGRQSDLASWIGKSALVTSSSAAPMVDGYVRGEVSLDTNASDMTVAFLDADGTVVGEQPLQPDATGVASFAWESAEPGAVVNVQVRRAGQAVDTPTKIWTSVIALSDPASANPELLTTSGQFSAQDVERLG
jgi:flagellar basal-body rod modification protein FlgD